MCMCGEKAGRVTRLDATARPDDAIWALVRAAFRRSTCSATRACLFAEVLKVLSHQCSPLKPSL